MPVLRFRPERLEKLTGLSIEGLRDALFRLKCETDLLEDGYLEVEVNPDRPDMYSEEGVARAVRGIAGLSRGWSPPPSRDSGLRLLVERVPSRPYIAAAVVYNVNISDEEDLRQLIQFQEKLHDTIGRRRRKAAIGFHDLEKLPSTTIRYAQLPVAAVRFAPLGSQEEVSAEEVLRGTEQGAKYGSMALRGGAHPFLLSGDKVIAMPPVVNSSLTRVEPGTRHLFIDVTGTHRGTVEKILDIIVSNLAERPGAVVGKVLRAGELGGWTPLLETKTLRVSAGYVGSVLGYHVTPEGLARLLERMRHRVASVGPGEVTVEVPPFRVDIIAPIDLVEDAAIALGYETLYPVYERPATRGGLLPETRLERAARDVLVGLGFTEVMQLALTGPSLLGATGLRGVEVENPVQLEYSVLRPSLGPGLLAVARDNLHAPKPVRAFEIGTVVLPGPREERRLGMMVMDSELSVDAVQAPLYALLEALGAGGFEVEPGCREPYLLEGRCGVLRLGGDELGWFGEASPEALEALGIDHPVALAEVRLGVILSWRSRTSGRA